MNGFTYELIGAAYGLSATRPESAMGPAVLRQSGLVERLRRVAPNLIDGGDVSGPEVGGDPGNPKLRYLSEYLEFAGSFITKLRQSYAERHTPIIFGGDHSISICSIAVAAEALKKTRGTDAELGLLWVDSHPDINTPETTPSGNIHGMSVGASLGRGEARLVNLCNFAPKLRPENIAFVGLRDIDPPEKLVLKELGITTFTMREVDLLGFGEVAQRALAQVTKNTAGFVTSFDLDVCDPSIAPGVCTPVRGGLTYREAQLMMELAAEARSLLSIEIVELNPYLDHNRATSDLAISLLESAVGKTIL